MATKKLTATIDAADLAAIRELVDAGRVTSVSRFIQQAVSVTLDDVSEWRALLAVDLDETGGPLTPDESAWADSVLGVRHR